MKTHSQLLLTCLFHLLFLTTEAQSVNDTKAEKNSDITMRSSGDHTEALVLLGRVWGFLKYHHPYIADGKYDWDAELIQFLPDYLKTSNPASRDELLLNWIDQYGTIKPCKPCIEEINDPYQKTDLSWLSDHKVSDLLAERIMFIHKNRLKGTHHYVEIVRGVGNPKFTNENEYADNPYPDQNHRLLALFRYWNIVQYFYPYRYVMDEDWDLMLPRYLDDFRFADDELAYERAVAALTHEIDDTHSFIYQGKNKLDSARGSYFPPFRLRWIEDQPVITDFYGSDHKNASGLRSGDVIIQVNGKAVSLVLKEMKPFYAASNHMLMMKKLLSNMLRSRSNDISLTILRDGEEMTFKQRLYAKSEIDIAQYYEKNIAKRPHIDENNIGYLYAAGLKQKDYQVIRKDFKDLKGIILDMRSYPGYYGMHMNLASMFVKDYAKMVKFSVGSADNPGTFRFTDPLTVKPVSPAFEGKLIVLVDENTQSQAEFVTMAFQQGSNTTVIGSTTAGADGDVSFIPLPGGIKTTMSGIGVYYPNGTPTQRIGIHIDQRITPTIVGIRLGKDELMEAAVRLILKDQP